MIISCQDLIFKGVFSVFSQQQAFSDKALYAGSSPHWLGVYRKERKKKQEEENGSGTVEMV